VVAQFTSQKINLTPNTTREIAPNPKIVVTPLKFRVQSVSEKSALFREKATYVKLYRHNKKYLRCECNGNGDNGEISFNVLRPIC
jgi:hypothetical protein